MVFLLDKIFLLLCFGAISSNGILMGDECDWIGSGLTSGEDRGVTPVYLRCREGRLKWLYPRGALRLIFHLPNDRQDFKVCIQSDTDIQEEPDLFTSEIDFYKKEVKKKKFPARIYLEGVRGLKPLYLPDDGDDRVVRCFYSKLGKAAVYVEADEIDGLRRAVAILKYEARPLPREAGLDDCRPCTTEEITLAYCTSDLVAIGEIVSMRQRSEYDTSELKVQVSKLIRHTELDGGDSSIASLLRRLRRRNAADRSLLAKRSEYDTSELKVQVSKLIRHTELDGGDSSIASLLRRLRRRNAADRSLLAKVHVPNSCDAAPGTGKLMLTARRRLGRLTLVCAPRLEDWERIIANNNPAPCRFEG